MSENNSKAMEDAKRQASSVVPAMGYETASIRLDGTADKSSNLKQMDVDIAAGLDSAKGPGREGTYANTHKNIDKTK